MVMHWADNLASESSILSRRTKQQENLMSKHFKEDLGVDFNIIPEFELGSKVKDKITGFKGIVIARTCWLNNCNTYGVRSQKLKDGKIQDVEWFDEPQLKIVKQEVFKARRSTGGPDRPVPQANR